MKEIIFFALIQLLVTWVLIGIVWYTQLIHYPLYQKIKEGFIEYERAHVRRAAYFMTPLMLIEIISAIILVGLCETRELIQLAILNLFLLILIWISTFLFQIIQHQKLSIRFSKKILFSLIASNWVRTLFWSLKGVVMALFIYLIIKESCNLCLEHIF